MSRTDASFDEVVAVLDANVLYGIEVTDLLATMAAARLFRPHWSPEILDEVARNLRRRRDLDPTAIERRLGHLDRAFPDALHAVAPDLVAAMPVNEGDRHVLALAVQVGAPTIVTENLKDFPTDLCDPFGVQAVGADTFVLGHILRHPDLMTAVIEAMAARRRRPVQEADAVISRLARSLPRAMRALGRTG